MNAPLRRLALPSLLAYPFLAFAAAYAGENAVVAKDERYIKGKTIYGVGIMQDPIVGSKEGKGRQDLISPEWMGALGQYMRSDMLILKKTLVQAKKSDDPFIFLMNYANSQFIEALKGKLKTEASRKFFLASSWSVMAAIEVDDFPFKKYTTKERQIHRDAFYQRYADAKEIYSKAQDESLPLLRMDLLPQIAIERLAIHCELCAIKFADPRTWEREGFPLGSRIASLKRHLDSVFAKKYDEDHIAHLLWNYMAVYQVALSHPDKNDL